ncbi:MAG: Ig-like domain-containing protein, partial [Planctomycetaceae bacterium]|nr:Ig-like domain-containing protein [Planctomycetaceae bacterium]
MQHYIYIKYLIFISLVLVFCACNRDNHLGTAVVRGTVKVNNQPVEGIEVIFSPVSGNGLPAYGQTDPNGNYFLTTAGTTIGSG